MMITLFHDMMHKEFEVYIDDMIAKSQVEKDHIYILRKPFKSLRKYKLNLNPAKCIFRVKSGKLFEFIVSNKGIKIDPDKVKVIQEMLAPHPELREVRGFLEKLDCIARFIF